MHPSIHAATSQARRPADIPADNDWFLIADHVYQAEVNIGPRPGRCVDPDRIKADAIEQVATVTALLERLVAVRADAVEVSYAAGATPQQVAAAMGLDSVVGAVLVGGDL